MPFKHFLRTGAVIGFLLVAATAGLAAPTKIVAFGDSLMAGFQLGPGESFPERLEQRLSEAGYEVEIANASVSGDTSTAGLARLEWSVPEDADIVILELGANDMLRGLDPAITRENLDRMIARLKARGAAVILAGMRAAPNLGGDYVREFDSIYADLARKHDVPLYPFILDGVAAQPDLLLEDGMHPNPAGVERMVEGILPVVTEVLERNGAGG